MTDAWWREGVLYQIYPRSFADSSGNGHGDLQGVIDRLEYLEWLGVTGIWLNPTFPSPNHDWGYDVSDYCGVHPDFGDLETMDQLIAEAGRRGIRVLLDLVPNHTSDQHPWFREHPEYYTWADAPNNWVSIFDGGPAWTRHASGRYYLRLFLPEQPDLNWWNPDVAAEFDRILAFWQARGVAGFRIDVCQSIVKDRLLRDDPGRSTNQPEVHDVLKRWRATTDLTLVGETYVYDLDQLVRYYGDGTDELHLGFNIPFIKSDLDVDQMRPIVEAVEAKLPATAWPTWTGSNHDAGRLATRWGSPRLALTMLLTLRGTPVLYYGDELGLTDGPVAPDQVRDHAGHRDACRTPMPWQVNQWARPTDSNAAPLRGAAPQQTGAQVNQWARPSDSWLPLHAPTTVAEQRQDAGSLLHRTRELIALRQQFAAAPYEPVDSPPGTWVYRRGAHTVALNFTDDEQRLEGQVVAPRDGVVVG